MNIFTFKRLLVVGGLMSVAILGGFMTQRTAHADSNVPTKAVVSGVGVAPVIECKWELPDMDSSTPGIQYTRIPPGHVHDDDMTVVPDADNDPTNGTQVPCAGPPASIPSMPGGVQHMIQVAPNLEDLPEQRQIALWLAAEHPNGISNISDVFWKVFHPDGSFKLQVHGTKVALADCAAYGTGTGPDGSMFEAAVHTGQMTAAAVDDINKGMIAKCQQQEKALYWATFPLSKDQACGQYRIEATAVAVGGVTTTLTNYIDVICTFALSVDFNTVDWGAITPGLKDIVSGDLLFLPPADVAPTVKNIGNDGMALKINFSQMVGASPGGKIIDQFDGCFGRSPATLVCIDPIAAGVPADFGALAAQVLCANEVGKLDLSVHPPAILPADTYTGTLLVSGYHVANACKGNVHIP